MERPSITIIIPALNEENNLENTVLGILEVVNGRFTSYEIFIFDDGSTDRTGKIAENLSARHSNIKVIRNKKTMGLAYNYKKGIELSKNEYLVMYHGDNEEKKESIKDMFNLIGKADMIIPYQINKRIRPFHRRLISFIFTTTISILTGLKLKYYNGPVIHKLELLKKIPITTYGFCFQAEILTQLIKLGYSYLEIGIYLQKPKNKVSHAFKFKNILSVMKFLLTLLGRQIIQ